MPECSNASLPTSRQLCRGDNVWFQPLNGNAWLGLQTIDGDEAFYFLIIDGQLHGAIITHVQDFNLARTDEFVEKVISVVERELTVSKIEENVFRFTDLR